ncbi:ABC transporter ATP-binding protein [uncultured Ferrovibrio sp.]|jgi:branched-chain amino acid transport system ATP-binding protein|uniref:ABC transporter ATP-binding protein n=1 Tax=uncultured Ferrovibrio sp. TaxID=1576913 RepID=UPI002622B6AD|nr:ABC transporter ATP-binding protein [uncultured Ferrovibrio sp.]
MLEIRNLKASYGAAPALWDISIAIKSGELVCVVGPNGAGKTTLINTIAGLHRAGGGSIVFDGRDMTRIPPHRFCQAGIAIVPESRRLFTSMTVLENLELGSYLPEARARRQETLEQVCELFPAVRQKLHMPAGSLSGGQQQMVAIGRALMARPKLLLLDEPSLGLAPSIVMDMFDVIRRVNADGLSILLVEQNVTMAMELASRAYVLEEGRVVMEGPASDLLQRPEVRKAYLGLE